MQSFPPPVPPPPEGKATNAPPEPQPPASYRVTKDQGILASALIVGIISSIAIWHFTVGISYNGALFIAIPAATAALLALIPRNTDRYSVFTGTMIAVLGSSIVIREGFICVLMAMPLIIPVVLITMSANRIRRQNRRAAWILPVLLLGAAGDGMAYELPTNVTVTETRTFETTAADLSNSLEGHAEIPELEPLLFKLPFPRPTAFTGTGADVGDIRTVEFGDNAQMGELVLEVTARTDDSITWDIIDNSTPVANWMTLHHAEASWIETPNGLDVTMAIEFDRELAPGFYFDPLERWGVGEMAEVLLDMIEHNLPDARTSTPNRA